MIQATTWDFDAKIVPLIVGLAGIGFCTLALLTDCCKRPRAGTTGLGEKAKADIAGKIHMDIASNISHLPTPTILWRGLLFFAWMGGFLGSMSLIGVIPTVPLFIVTFMRVERREPWRIVIPMALVMTAFIYILFDQLLGVTWPSTVLGGLFPALHGVVPSL
jgi:hypothetical protein